MKLPFDMRKKTRLHEIPIALYAEPRGSCTRLEPRVQHYATEGLKREVNYILISTSIYKNNYLHTKISSAKRAKLTLGCILVQSATQSKNGVRKKRIHLVVKETDFLCLLFF